MLLNKEHRAAATATSLHTRMDVSRDGVDRIYEIKDHSTSARRQMTADRPSSPDDMWPARPMLAPCTRVLVHRCVRLLYASFRPHLLVLALPPLNMSGTFTKPQ
jgi:hypothetical protein